MHALYICAVLRLVKSSLSSLSTSIAQKTLSQIFSLPNINNENKNEIPNCSLNAHIFESIVFDFIPYCVFNARKYLKANTIFFVVKTCLFHVMCSEYFSSTFLRRHISLYSTYFMCEFQLQIHDNNKI